MTKLSLIYGGSMVALDRYIRAPRWAVIAGAEIEASLDLLGDGSLIAPIDGPINISSWVEEDTGIADHAWQNIKTTSHLPTAKPEEIR